MHEWEKGVYGKSLYLPLNLKCLLKISQPQTISLALHSLSGKSEIINMNCKAFEEQNSACVPNFILLPLLPLLLYSFQQCFT